ncbi:hypothetical protein [Methanolobus sp. WCC4]|uniref:hypothetical protein n=1 Tax=Methanolobus sp. WCC4 TaxID=3125784 RepID=UPI0030F71404
MKQRMIALCMLLTLVFVFIPGCIDENPKEEEMTSKDIVVNETEFAEVMKEANTAYVKALVSTSRKDTSSSQIYIDELVEKLTYVSDTYGEAAPEMYATDKYWQTEIKRAVIIAEYSQEMLDEGDIEAAHEALEPMRDLFFGLHERNDVLHMGDHLTMFHMTMEETITAANENNTEMLTLFIPKMEEQWQDVKDAERPDSADASYDQSLAAVDTAIEMLNGSVETGNITQVQQDAGSLKLAFADVFSKYGVVIS